MERHEREKQEVQGKEMEVRLRVVGFSSSSRLYGRTRDL